MFNDFHLAAIVKNGREVELRRIPLHQKLQKELNTDWKRQYDDFTKGINKIDFSIGYSPGEGE